MTISAFTSFIVIPFSGNLVQRYDSIRILQLSGLLSVIGYLDYLISKNLVMVFIATLFIMVADRLYQAAWPTTVSHYLEKKNLHFWFSVTNSIRTVSILIGSAASFLIIKWNQTLGMKICLFANILSYWIAIVILNKMKKKSIVDSKSNPSRNTFKKVFKDRYFKNVFLAQYFLAFYWLLPIYYFPLLIMSKFPSEVAWSSLVVLVRYFCIGAFQILIQRLLGKFAYETQQLVSILIGVTAICVTFVFSSRSSFKLVLIGILVSTFLIATAECISKPLAVSQVLRSVAESDHSVYMANFQLTWVLPYALGPFLSTYIVNGHEEWILLLIGFALFSAIFNRSASSLSNFGTKNSEGQVK